MANSTGKAIGLVALGGITDAVIYYFTQKYINESVQVDKMSFNAADAASAGTALAALGIGMASKKTDVTLFGAGALAASLGSMAVKPLVAYNLSATKLGNGYAGPVAPKPSGIPPTAALQQMLVVGTQGGGHVVYKPTKAPQNGNSNAGLNNLFV